MYIYINKSNNEHFQLVCTVLQVTVLCLMEFVVQMIQMIFETFIYIFFINKMDNPLVLLKLIS